MTVALIDNSILSEYRTCNHVAIATQKSNYSHPPSEDLRDRCTGQRRLNLLSIVFLMHYLKQSVLIFVFFDLILIASLLDKGRPGLAIEQNVGVRQEILFNDLNPFDRFYFLPLVVIGGGFALFIYKIYLADPKLENLPVGTRDIDSLIPRKVPEISKKNIAKYLNFVYLKI
ncbi:MAG TPA: hypothetical protein VJK48_00590 [Chlamydiales bacterium]|nr:hypothetical protein [Chlamydiales bacterium]